MRSILVAISGGQDSLCLIKLMQKYQNRLKEYELLTIEYIYIDHQWKNDSKQQIRHIINYIQNIRQDISIYEIQNISKSEMEARNLRYNIIINHALKNECGVVLTAHTSTDCIETFFQQIIRGTSIDGATSLHCARRLNNQILLLRPLINFSRIEINWFCRKFCLPIWSDITNYEYKIQRNRLRYELIPYLNQYFAVNIEKQINSFLQISNLENEYIKQNCIKLYLKSIHKVNIALNYRIIKNQHMAIQTRVLQIFLYHNFNRKLNSLFLHDLIMKLKMIKPNYSRFVWQNLNFHIYNNWLYVY